MAFEYKLVKSALKEYLKFHLSLDDSQVFRAPPRPTEINLYPAVIIRSATAVHEMVGDDGPTRVSYTLLVGLMTRNASSQGASDDLDDLLKLMDTKIAEMGLSGFPSTGLTNSRWAGITRLAKQTQFDNVIQDDVGMVVYGVSAGVEVQEQTPYMDG